MRDVKCVIIADRKRDGYWCQVHGSWFANDGGDPTLCPVGTVLSDAELSEARSRLLGRLVKRAAVNSITFPIIRRMFPPLGDFRNMRPPLVGVQPTTTPKGALFIEDVYHRLVEQHDRLVEPHDAPPVMKTKGDGVKHQEGSGLADRTAVPVCPFCEQIESDYWDLDGVYDDDADIETECGSCGKAYRIRTHVLRSFTTHPLEER